MNVDLALVGLVGLLSSCQTSSVGLRDTVEAEDNLAKEGDVGVGQLRFETSQTQLPTGLKVAFDHAQTRGMVGIYLTIGTGSGADPSGKEGLAHLVEHLAFRSKSPQFNGRTFEQHVQWLGGTFINATTRAGETTYHAYGPRAVWPQLMDAMASVLDSPLAGIDERAVMLEASIAANEVTGADETGLVTPLVNRVYELALPDLEGWQRRAADTPESYKRLTLADAEWFVQQHYNPTNASLLVVSDAEAKRLVAGLPRTWGSPRTAKAPLTSDPHKKQTPPAIAKPALIEGPFEKPGVAVVFRLPSLYGAQGHLSRLVTSADVAGWYEYELEQLADVAKAEVLTLNTKEATVVAVFLLTKGKPEELALRRSASEILARAFSAHMPGEPSYLSMRTVMGLEQRRLGLMRVLATAQVLFDDENFVDRSERRARAFHMTGDAGFANGVITRLSSAKSDEVEKFSEAQFAFAQSKSFAFREKQPLVPRAIGKTTSTAKEVAQTSDAAVAETVSPPPGKASAALDDLHRFHLANGLDVVIAPYHDYPTVTVAMGFRGGSAGSASPAVADLLRRIQGQVETDGLANGIATLQADEPDMAIDVVRAGKGALANALLVLAQRISMSDANEVWARYYRAGLSESSKKADPAVVARKQLMAVLYPKHSYGHLLEASDYAKVTDAQLRAYLPMLHRPDNATLVIAGNVDPAQAEKLVRRRFDTWKGDEHAKAPRIPAAPAPAEGQSAPIVVAKDESLQVQVTVGCRLPVANDPLAAARSRVIKSIIYRAYWNSLRSELGLSYSTDVQPTLLQGGSHLLATTSIDADRFAEAWPVIASIWRRLQAGDLKDAELQDAQREALAANNLHVNGSSSMALVVLSALRNKWDPQTQDQFGSLIKAADATAIRKDLAVCTNSLVTTVVGSSAVIKDAKITR